MRWAGSACFPLPPFPLHPAFPSLPHRDKFNAASSVLMWKTSPFLKMGYCHYQCKLDWKFCTTAFRSMSRNVATNGSINTLLLFNLIGCLKKQDAARPEVLSTFRISFRRPCGSARPVAPFNIGTLFIRPSPLTAWFLILMFWITFHPLMLDYVFFL